jgi:two-component system sensor histidine kinase MprB
VTLRRLVTLLSALAVSIAVTLASAASYVAVRGAVQHDIDHTLTAQAHFVATRLLKRQTALRLPAPPPRRGGPISYAQLVTPDGATRLLTDTSLRLPTDARVLALARGGTGDYLSSVRVGGSHLRVLTVATKRGALQLARPMDGMDAILSRLRWVLAAVCLAGVGLAAGLGRLIGRRLVAPIREVAAAAHHISETEDLGRRIQPRRADEVGELAAEFNAMLDTLQTSQAALDRSAGAQRQLVADASHELRTPITALRANVELLEETDPARLAPGELAGLLADLRGQADELGALVTDIIELAREAEPSAAREDCRLDHLVEEALARTRRHAPAARFAVDLRPVTVEGVPERLGRAINNLLDNAVQHGGTADCIDVRVDAGGVIVRDRGPGIPPEDLEHVFDRFYRSAASRNRPGTGLGLAIVRQVAETHGGSVEARNAPDGGAILTLALPGEPVLSAPLVPVLELDLQRQQHPGDRVVPGHRHHDIHALAHGEVPAQG